MGLAALFDFATLFACGAMLVARPMTRLQKDCDTKGDVAVAQGWHACDEHWDSYWNYDATNGLQTLFDFATLLACGAIIQ